MPSANTNRRLSPPILNQDTDSLNGLNTIQGYSTQRQEATPEAVHQAYQVVSQILFSDKRSISFAFR